MLMAHYQKPSFLLTKVANPMMMKLVKMFGLERTGVEVLTVNGRTSGKPRPVPVNPLEYDGKNYLVCPRGEAEWVRNLRTAGIATLEKKGKRAVVSALELPDAEKAPILKEYLRCWEKAAGSYFGLGANASIEQLAGIAPKHPVFEITRETA